MTAIHRLLLGAAVSGLALAAASRAATNQPSAAERADPFVGARACAACHAQMHDTWTRGRHSRMLQPAGASTVVGDFSKSSITLHGRTFQLREADGAFFVTESYLTGKPQERRIEFTLGSRRVQHY